MIQLDIICGLLGAVKTTLIRRLLQTDYKDKKIAIVENEAGKVNLDAEAFDGEGLAIQEVTAGCICCTVRGGFQEAILYLKEHENPDVIVVEPSGLADIRVVLEVCRSIPGVQQNRVIMVVNGRKALSLIQVAGEFFTDQIRYADCIYLNFAEMLSEEKLLAVKAAVRKIRPRIQIIDVPVEEIKPGTFQLQTKKEMEEADIWSKKPRIQIPGKKAERVFRGMNRIEGEESIQYVSFEEAFSEEKLQKLIEDLKDRGDSLWRAKGCLRMEDGSLRKLDLVYGDVFVEKIRKFPEDKTNMLVLIGKETI